MPEQEKIPLLSLFSAWVPPADLRPMLVEMLVTGAVIDKRVRSIQADLQCPVCPSDALRTRMEQELASAYGVRSVAFRFFTPAPAQAAAEVEEAPPMPTEADMPPEPEETCPQHLDMAPEDPMEIFRRTERIRQEALRNIKPAVPSEKREKASGNKLLFGKIIKRFPCIEMKDIALDSEMVTIEGDVFATDHVEMKKRGAWIVRFDITDRTNSIRVAKFLVGDEGKALAGALKEGQHLIVQGRVSPYQGELQIEPPALPKDKGRRPGRTWRKRGSGWNCIFTPVCPPWTPQRISRRSSSGRRLGDIRPSPSRTTVSATIFPRPIPRPKRPALRCSLGWRPILSMT